MKCFVMGCQKKARVEGKRYCIDHDYLDDLFMKDP